MRAIELRATDLKHFFEIRRDLAAAGREGRSEDVAHHIDELEILAMYTDSDRLRRACKCAVARCRSIADAVA